MRRRMWQEVGLQQQQSPPNRDYLLAGGTPVTEADVALALGNWGSITAVTGATVTIPHTQTGPATTVVAALVMMPLSSGIFLVTARASYSDGTTGGALAMTLGTKQGASTGQLTGGVAAAKFGSGAPGAGAGLSPSFVGSNGQILNVDANGGLGLLLEGAAAFSVTQHTDLQATLTGLLTANGAGVQAFSFIGLVDSVGPTSLVKTPFTLGRPVSIGLALSDTAAHLVTFDSLSIFAIELPVS